MHLRQWVVSAALFFSATVICAAQQVPVLMISIDGMRPDYVTHADEHGLRIPTLRQFLNNGTYADGVTGVFPTVTYPSHTTLVTGVWPSEHGIVNNQRFDPERKLDGAWYWYEDAINVPTLWSTAHAKGLTTASVGWPVTVDSRDINYLIPEYWRGKLGDTANPDDRWLMDAISKPAGELKAIAGRTGVPFMKGNDTTIAGDEVKTRYALDILARHRPAFMTIHLSSLDEEQHLHGPFSPEANADLEQLDPMIARLIAAERANNPDAVIAVVSDHGFTDVDHLVNLGAPFIAAGLVHIPADPGGSISWKAQPWPLGCMFAIMLHDPEDHATEEEVRQLLTKLAANPDNGIEAVLDRQEVAKLGGVPGAAFVVTLREGFAPGPNLSGNLVTPLTGHHGTHGYNPRTTPAMRASFLVEGRGIAHGKHLGVIDMRQIAPTLARQLGSTLEQASEPALDLR